MPSRRSLTYPRNIAFRRAANTVARGFLRLLTEIIITGREHLPERGPVILVGNHSDLIEVVLMAVYAPWPVEILGVGDIPLDPGLAWFIERYGYIPINRGNIDRAGLNQALSVLQQGGAVGIFPDGGIWEVGARQARTGVAWLSHAARAPVIPIGFGGIHGALGRVRRFEHPRLEMNIGPAIPPVHYERPGERKAALEAAANHIMDEVRALIPERDRWRYEPIAEVFDFDLTAVHPDGAERALYDALTPDERAALGKFFYRPVLLNTFARNLRLPVDGLQQFETQDDPARIGAAAAAIVDYIRNTNPQFFNYRFGYEAGAALLAGLEKLAAVAGEAERRGERLKLKPLRHEPA